VRRLEKLNIPFFQASPKIMTLIRLAQRASILAGMTFSSLPFYSNSAHAEDVLACVIASNGKTVCGTLKEVERACITTNAGSTVCGKFKSAKGDGQEEARTPAPIAGYRKEVDNFVLTLESCKRVDEIVRCQIKIFNKGTKKDIGIDTSGSSLLDLAGRSHPGSVTDFGSGYGSTTAEINSKTDIIVSITFNNIPGQIVKAQLLNLAFYKGIKPIQFRNVPVSN
jgi:hypothetical protein